MIHRPYLQITLSTKALGLEEGPKGRNVTCQYLMVRRRKSTQSEIKTAAQAVTTAKEGVSIAANKAKNDGTGGEEEKELVGEKVVKRKAGSSQSSDSIRGGKKRKK